VLEEIRDLRADWATESERTRADWAAESERTRADWAAESERTRTEMAREFKQTRAAIENNTRVCREILLELRDHRTRLDSIDQGVQSSVDGLLHVLDELRGGQGGPGTAPAI
jgi:hypothetical protein